MAKKQTAGGGRSTLANNTPLKNMDRTNKRTQPTALKTQATNTARPARARKSAAPRRAIMSKKSRGQRLRQFIVSTVQRLREPEFWQQAARSLPPWIDEVGAILLIVVGVVALTALLNTTSEAMLSVTLSDILRQLFGGGAYLIALGILAVGVIILLPKFGISIRLGWAQIAAIEVSFGAFEALLHLAANDPEPRVLARSGGGGGYLGWALSYLLSSLGWWISVGLFGVLLAGGVIVTTGLRRRHVIAAVERVSLTLQNTITQLEVAAAQPPPPTHSKTIEVPGLETGGSTQPAGTPPPYSRASLVPRDIPAQAGTDPGAASRDLPANPGHSHSVRPANRQASKISDPEAQLQRSQPAPALAVARQVPKRSLTKAEREKLVNQTRERLGAANGRSLVAPGEPGERPSIVPREFLPDARAVPAAPRARMHRQIGETERYFTVEDFREVKKIGKRDDNLPPMELLSDVELNKPTEEEINTNAKIIKNTLLEFEVDVEVIDVKVGPTVTQYAVSPYTETITDEGETVLNRVRVGEIARLNNDLALALSAKRLRIEAPVPGYSYVGVEVPNRQPSTVALRPVLESEAFYQNRKRPLALPLGRDVSGEPFIADLQTMPHLLIAGTTGSGKSIMLAAMTTAFVLNNSPDRVKLALLDPKMVELSRFNGLPHLIGPVETELDRIIEVLRWSTREMDVRYKLLEKEAARNIEAYNRALGRRRKDEHLPYIVIIIDEIGDLMMQRPDETERALTRLAQMARAVGIHLMVATQRPSVDVITGLIKANFPARISFAVASGIDSRVVLDYTGAESLMGNGDMLFLAPDAAGPRRIQGCYISDEEVNAVVKYWKNWSAREIEAGRMEPRTVGPWERGLTRREVLAETDPLLEEAIALVIAAREASASLLQRRMGVGYPRAARLMDLMQELGVVGGARAGGRTREVLVKPGADPFKKIVEKRMKKKS